MNNSFELHDKFYSVVKDSKNYEGQTFNVSNGNSFAKVVFDKGVGGNDNERQYQYNYYY